MPPVKPVWYAPDITEERTPRAYGGSDFHAQAVALTKEHGAVWIFPGPQGHILLFLGEMGKHNVVNGRIALRSMARLSLRHLKSP